MTTFYRYCKENLEALAARQQGLHRAWLVTALRQWPGIYREVPGRRAYRLLEVGP